MINKSNIQSKPHLLSPIYVTVFYEYNEHYILHLLLRLTSKGSNYMLGLRFSRRAVKSTTLWVVIVTELQLQFRKKTEGKENILVSPSYDVLLCSLRVR
jgi:hypothetical protein